MKITEREDEEITELCRLNSAASQAGLRHAVKEELQIELLRVTVSEIKLSSGFSLNDHTGSYVTVLTEGGGSVAMAAGRAGDRPDADTLTGRRDDTSLQGTATSTVAAREAEEDVTMKAVLLQLIDTAAFNLAFLTVTKAATAP
ncbi:hypothetical protein BDDG_02290 [Blastomyces dermatitidis ATCC 18188]|uniref:Uncharacterized protein n=1 Tax=Ajellomyces dermatitidis (strain ATCC 18188 / CBS 674.68) TaxID=653446 RepID=F2T7Y8_AJEDA|nr:hypothetical protein BDDG_02290 [Blastomyces dermatitidis ATCC 18188]